MLPLITGKQHLEDEEDVWNHLRNPLQPRSDDVLFDQIREYLELDRRTWFTARSHLDLGEGTRERLHDDNERLVQQLRFFARHNPIVRHTVVRRWADLEKRGLLPRIAVDIHPIRTAARRCSWIRRCSPTATSTRPTRRPSDSPRYWPDAAARPAF